jgi:hypothetical protein
MKKYLFFFISILFFVSTVYGQWSVGPRIGMDVSVFTGKDNQYGDINNKWVPGLVVGAAGGYSFTDLITVRAELLFVSMGVKTTTKYEEGEKSTEYEFGDIIRYSFGYFQLPLLVLLTYNLNKVNIIGSFGPYTGFKLCGKYKQWDLDGNLIEEGKVRFQSPDSRSARSGDDIYFDPEYSSRWDFGLYFGAGAGMKVGPGHLEADFRFGLGLLNHDKTYKDSNPPEGYKADKTRSFNITFAYVIPLGKETPARYLSD